METATFLPWLRLLRVLPLVALDDPADAHELARALASLDLTAVELCAYGPGTPRLLAALTEAAPELVVGVSVTRPGHVRDAAAAGAHFVSVPSVDRELLQGARQAELPAIATVGGYVEAVAASRESVRVARLEITAPEDGLALVQRYGRLFPRLRLLPSGAIGPDRIPGYLNEPSVIAVATTCPLERLSR